MDSNAITTSILNPPFVEKQEATAFRPAAAHVSCAAWFCWLFGAAFALGTALLGMEFIFGGAGRGFVPGCGGIPFIFWLGCGKFGC